MARIVLVTGGFDPLHSGHIEYFKAARRLGDKLVVGLNSDDWLKRKKGRAFMPFTERSKIAANLRMVDCIVDFNDDDGSARDAIRWVRKNWPDDTIVFANGGDRTQDNIPEMDIEDPDLEFVFGVGGEDKMNSSSWILESWTYPRTERAWGHYDVLREYPGCKLKELVVEPNRCLSYQRHEHRNELWYVRSGTGQAVVQNGIGDRQALDQVIPLRQGEVVTIPAGYWHQLINSGAEQLSIIEIQYGERCLEEDIERR